MNAKEQPECESSTISVDSNVVYFGVIYKGTRVLRFDEIRKKKRKKNSRPAEKAQKKTHLSFFLRKKA